MQNITDQIKDASNIVEVISDFVTLSKRGTNYIGCCPFHNEKTPSFTVSPSKRSFKCFGCGVGGDVFEFIQKHEAYTFPEAMKYLGKKYNIAVDFKETDESRQQKSEAQSLRIAAESITKYLVKCLDEKARNYLINDRGFNTETIAKWEIGYSPNEWQAITNHATKEGINTGLLLQMGYIGKSTTNERLYDRLKDRIIFPIHDIAGNIIGFNARVLGKADEKTAKYINSNNNPLFDKSRALFGIFHAKKAIQQADRCILVEGPTDVISLHQAGIKNVVGSNGTALTIEQLKLIQRFSSHLTIMTDGDAAGKKATAKDIGLALSLGFRVDIVPMENGTDPDSLTRQKNTEQLSKIINKAVDFIEWKASELKHNELEGTIERTQAIKELVAYLAQVPDTIMRNLYIQKIASRLQIEETLLDPEINKLREKLKQQTESSSYKYAYWPWYESMEAIQETATSVIFTDKQQTVDAILNGRENSLYLLRLPSENEIEKLHKICKKVFFRGDVLHKYPNMQYNETVETLKLMFAKGIDIVIESDPTLNLETGDYEHKSESFYEYYITALIASIDRSDMKQLDTAIEKAASITAHLSENLRAVKIEWIKDQFKINLHKLNLASFKKRVNEYLKTTEKKNGQKFSIGTENHFGLTEAQTEDLQNYKLYFKDNRMFFDTHYGVQQYSNFIIIPVLHTISTNDSKKVFKLINIEGNEALITLGTEEMNNLNKFMVAIEKLGNFFFDGENKQLKALKRYLYDRTTYSYEIETFGWQRDGFWAWSNGIDKIEGTQLMADEYGIITTENRDGKEKTYYFKPASKQFSDDYKVFVQEKKFRIKESELSFDVWATQLIKVYGKKAILPICGLFTTVYSDYIFSQLGNLPLINLFGPKGTGKTELGKSILSVFGERQEEINVTKVTPYAASHSLSMFSNAFILFDEYKNNIGSMWIEFFKSIFNRQGRVKGSFKEGQDTITVPVNSMVFLCGQEMPTADIALLSRCVFYSIYSVSHDYEATEAFNKLKEMDDMGKTHFIRHWLQFRPNIEEDYNKYFYNIQKELKQQVKVEADDRVIRNYATLLATMAVLENKISIPFTMADAKEQSIKAIAEQMDIMNSSSEVGQFWNLLIYLLEVGQIKNPANYNIKNELEIIITRRKEGVNVNEKISFHSTKGKELLYLRWDGLYQKIAIAGNQAKIEVMPEKSLLHYLEHSSAFIGKKRWRFGEFVNQALVFDYSELRVNLKRDPLEKTDDETSNSIDETDSDELPVEIKQSEIIF